MKEVEPELESITAFVAYLTDDERKTYSRAELNALAKSLGFTTHDVQAELSSRGFSLEVRRN